MDQPTMRRVARYLGYLVFFLVLFFAFFLRSFPIERFQKTVEKQLGQFLNREVKVGEIALSFTGNLVLSDVEIGLSKGRGNGAAALLQAAGGQDGKPGEKEKSRNVLAYDLDRVTIDIGLFAWLFDKLDIEIDADAMGGEIVFEYSGPLSGGAEGENGAKPSRNRAASAKGGGVESGAKAGGGKPLRLFVDVREISLKQLIDLRDLLPVPVSGNLSLTMEVSSDSGSFSDSGGKASFSLSDLEFSRKGYESEFFNLRIAVPPLRIDKVTGEFAIAKGECELGAFTLRSKDVEVKLEGGITLKDPMTNSVFDLYVMFKVLDAYIAKSETLKTIMPDLGTLSLDMRRAQRDDGFWGFRYQGPFGFAKFTPTKTFTRVHKDKARTGRTTQGDRSRKSRFRKRPSFPIKQVITPPEGEPTSPPSGPANPAALPGPGGEPPGGRPAAPAQNLRAPEPDREANPAREEEQPADTAGREEPAEKEEAVEKQKPEEKDEGEQKPEGEDKGKEEGDQKAEEGKGEDQGGEKGGNEEEGKGKEKEKEKDQQGEGSGSHE